MSDQLDELPIPNYAQNDKSSISILPEEEQKDFEDKMDMYLLGS